MNFSVCLRDLRASESHFELAPKFGHAPSLRRCINRFSSFAYALSFDPMFIEQLQKDPRFFFAMLITIVVSICLHELAHGFAAIWLGDRTPIESGHMTLSPIVHMGIASLICLLLAGIAWGAMPVNPSRQRGKYAQAIVAAAGPAMNILLAILALTSLGLWMRFDTRPVSELSEPLVNLQYLLRVFGWANVLLALFNLIPLPPLDGSRILANFSEGYGRLLSGLLAYSPMAILQISVLVFSIAGTAISPVAGKLAFGYLSLVRGF